MITCALSVQWMTLKNCLQILSGGVQGGVTIWEINEQKLLARQHVDTGSSSIGETGMIG